MKPNPQLFEQIADGLGQVMSHGQKLSDDAKATIKALVQAKINELDLVQRDELEAQQAAIESLREQVAALQAQVEALSEKS
ncbi:accessory factor UbiK family protein [Salinibius halmophilus]|uniref:accessory factor UbiK family protein n=1 Tax=Salinibius halmophilus TaxID=1853216 RepID=UPI000E664A6E|nr:accessory factor UbiK family protein [Salinibius halmophilus]